jgi:tetratricopeptide (TPR) repeat protein
MKQPATAEEVLAFHKIRQSDPRRALQICSDWIGENPESASAYFSRHQVWLDLGKPTEALGDINRSIELKPRPYAYWARGDIHRLRGDYKDALADYDRAEAFDPDQWERDAMPLLYQADVHARLGDVASALACSARLHDQFWTPGHNDLPAGGKVEIDAELRRRAALARQSRR